MSPQSKGLPKVCMMMARIRMGVNKKRARVTKSVGVEPGWG